MKAPRAWFSGRRSEFGGCIGEPLHCSLLSWCVLSWTSVNVCCCTEHPALCSPRRSSCLGIGVKSHGYMLQQKDLLLFGCWVFKCFKQSELSRNKFTPLRQSFPAWLFPSMILHWDCSLVFWYCASKLWKKSWTFPHCSPSFLMAIPNCKVPLGEMHRKVLGCISALC